uniref:Uncharacterized protein n=1 Tax=Lepeophtheirus salmonis TaxID=72036 RepID=A0A0K2T8R9_LEPSM
MYINFCGIKVMTKTFLNSLLDPCQESLNSQRKQSDAYWTFSSSLIPQQRGFPHQYLSLIEKHHHQWELKDHFQH